MSKNTEIAPKKFRARYQRLLQIDKNKKHQRRKSDMELEELNKKENEKVNLSFDEKRGQSEEKKEERKGETKKIPKKIFKEDIGLINSDQPLL